MAHIRLERVEKTFGRQRVFRGLDLEIREGETMVVLGESGQGKSVMLKMLIGLIRPDRGRIFVDDIDLTTLDEKGFQPIRRRISMLFQGGALFDSLTVGENVAYPIREHEPELEEEQIVARVREKLSMVGLEREEKKMPSQLSGGMKKRVALARAIASANEVLLYDEPTTGLDPINTRRISELINRLKTRLELTSIVVTHDISAAFFVGDRIALLVEGVITAVMSKEDFLRSDRADVREFMEAMPHPQESADAAEALQGAEA